MPNNNVSGSTDICNQALAHIGWTRSLNSINDATPEGTTCLAFYGQARDEVMQEFDWPFLTHHLRPALLDPVLLENGVVPQNWRFAVLEPPACLKLHGVYRFSDLLDNAAQTDKASIEAGTAPVRWNNNDFRIWHRNPDQYRQVRYTRESDANLGQIILTDCDLPIIEYLGNTGKTVNGVFQEDATQWDPDFVACVAERLASYLAGALKKEPALRMELKQASKASIAQAASRAAQEIQKDMDPLPLYMQQRRWSGFGRRGGGSGY